MRLVGFTGTRRGMTAPQRKAVAELLEKHATEFHHGLCVGADEEAHAIAWSLGIPIIGHPPTRKSLQAILAPGEFKAMREEADYIERNRHIVDETSLLIAAPHGPEERRSGTWSTVRYARRLNRPIAICRPDGVVTSWSY